ncbi:MAG TPA: hypothetical protein VM422_02065, partial [Amaricoccus sp.]|nr:hypothetical protein [Amaricoccus sp.]
MLSRNEVAETRALTPPRIYLVRMGVFLVLAGFLVFILYRPIWAAFLANPGLNGLILGVLLIGIVLAIRQVVRLFREVRWVNDLGRSDDEYMTLEQPVRLARLPISAAIGASRTGLSVTMTRSLLDSIAARLDENRELVRYLAGLLVFLGLLGTFWGLIDTVGSVGKVIQSMRTGAEAGALFDELKSGLAAPLSGMGLSFSASLFGLAGSLVLGFLDLQAGQAQSRFYTELEDWLARATTDPGGTELAPRHGPSPDLILALNKLTTAVNEGAGGRAATQAMANLAEGIQGLVQHMRAEQQMIRDWVEAQAAREKELKQVLERGLLGRDLAGEEELRQHEHREQEHDRQEQRRQRVDEPRPVVERAAASRARGDRHLRRSARARGARAPASALSRAPPGPRPSRGSSAARRACAGRGPGC